jgi:hypothetical protein
MKRLQLLSLLTIVAFMVMMIVSCTKEGPAGPAGKDGADGTNGTNGTDGTAGCIECHNPESVELIATQYELSKHFYGEAAFEEAGSTGCTPCHCSEAFKYVCENNISAAFTLNPTTNKYVNGYATIPTAAYGDITCSTCHNSIHTTYTTADVTLTTVAPVEMSMWGAGKTIDCQADGGISNLCIKCHQPRPLTASAGDGNVIDYNNIAANPTAMFYDPDGGTTTQLKPGYRTHTHYGTAGAIFAGMGGVEFAGEAYDNSAHTAGASCQDCHMATIQGAAGGHTFVAKGNFNGCNTTDCHSDVSSSSDIFWTNPRAAIKEKLDALAAALQIGGIDIMNRNPDSESNLWIGNTTNKYDGYLNIYDPINNPEGINNNPGGTFQNPTMGSSWTQEQKDFNLTLPKITLSNAQMGSIINFQLCLRDYSLGIHNYSYTSALLTNSLSALGAN